MKENYLRQIILESVRQALYESWYTKTATPYVSKAEAQRELGRNPLRTDVGGHAAHDEVKQPSTFDRNGANFDGEHIVVSDNRFTFYKVKNFGTTDIKDTLSLFGNGASAERELRKEIDTVNGAADRNGKSLTYRAIVSEKNPRIKFWEFSFDYGQTWYILKPQPVQNMKQSKFNK